ncbi:MAG: aminotransferase class I/II-fold pyridoxal phosphate-dependent enzyme [Lachnospiraceae bacterium]|nr:aminotransferase class I/II-fold pyridoxal phosphate-dependent enzyme [Lachnospiraceae bacterium]
MESLFEQLRRYGEGQCYPYHMPGHKRNALGDLPEEIAGRDITEIEGFDNLHDPRDLFVRLQQEAAALYGAEKSFYLVNGSTCGILSAISAVLPKGGHILMSRGSHKSAYHAVYLRNLTVSYLYPELIPGYDIFDAITAGQVEEALQREPDIGAVFLVSPTYEGRIAPIEEIARIVHRRGIPLIVDEAHGAHLGLAEGFARNSCQAGADIVIHSVHKTLPAMTQTALLHVNGRLVDRELLQRFLHIYQTSSPSYILMASIDNALRVAARNGEELFGRFLASYCGMLKQLTARCRYLKFLLPEAGRQDIGKLVILTRQAGLSGQKLYDILLKEYQLQLEMASESFCLAMFTIGDGQEGYTRMTEALLAVDARIGAGALTEERPEGKTFPTDFSVLCSGKEDSRDGKVSLSQAWDCPARQIPLEQAAGYPTAEFVNLYPPGVPILVPGEIFAEELCRKLKAFWEQGLHVQGIFPEVTQDNGTRCMVRVIDPQ